jgi:hypothetical protein
MIAKALPLLRLVASLYGLLTPNNFAETTRLTLGAPGLQTIRSVLAFPEYDTCTGTTRYNTVGTAAISVRYNTVQ